MRVAGVARLGGATVAGFVAGAVLALGIQSPAVLTPPGSRVPPTEGSKPLRKEAPETFLAWIPGGLPDDFSARVASLRGIQRMVVVRSGLAWLDRSFSAQGELVDRAPKVLGFPLEVAAVNPAEYAPFLPPGERGVIVPLAAGEGVLGTMSAELRGLGPGAILEFGGTKVRIAAVLPDELVGAHELLVSRATGRALGLSKDRYALLQPTEAIRGSLRRRLLSAFSPGTLLQVRAPGETPYFRQGDAVLPPVRLKQLFGEFAARPRGGFVDPDPAWVNRNIVRAPVPLLGEVTCHRGILPQLRGALRELVRRGLESLVKPEQYAGCYSARFINRVPDQALSHHSWGIALDINVGDNPYGAPPNQDPRLVDVFERWGFNWGGKWILPDGMHFEFRAFPIP